MTARPFLSLPTLAAAALLLAAGTAGELEALLPAVLDRAFAGEL